MDVSSSTNTNANVESGKDPIKRAIETQEKQILQVIEDAQEQSKQVTAQKTGVGSNINITG